MEIKRDKNQIMAYNLPAEPINEKLKQLKDDRVISRIWKCDHTVWKDSPEEISNRLGWLNSHLLNEESLNTINSLVKQVTADGCTHALLVGMGGSSMAPEVFRKVFGVQNGYLDLHILDSTDPEAVLEKDKTLDPQKTLFIVSTKSGGTVETISLMKYFYNRAIKKVGKTNAGRHFIAITDPGSSLEKTAQELGFRNIFLNNPHIGGRYSALSYFGLVPAALVGVDVIKLLDNADKMAQNAAETAGPVDNNTPAWLGTVLGILGKSGRDKITIISSPPIQPFGAWLEQLLAESTGKEGKGLLPVDNESLAPPEIYADDRLFVYFRLEGDKTHDKKADILKAAGHPFIQLNLQDIYDLGGEYFRWMMATAVAGWAMQINPFDQPNVESAKVLARKMVEEYLNEGGLSSFTPDLESDGIEVYFEQRAENLKQVWHQFLNQAEAGEKKGKGRSYFAIQAYLKPEPETDHALQLLRDKIRDISRMAVTVGYGPRFLHSTGQLHKGDAGNGMFIQLTSQPEKDLPIPDQPGSEDSSISFGILKSAQALGDRQALIDAGRKVIRFHFKQDLKAALDKLTGALQ